MTSKSAELHDLLRRRAVAIAQERDRDGYLYKSYETFVLAHGRSYESAEFDEDEHAHVRHMLREHRRWWVRGFQYRHCFTNVQELLAFDTSGAVVYVEGFVWAYGDRLPPVHHGWLSLHGKVIDVTAPTRASVRKKLPLEPPQLHGEFKGREYLGVPFLRSYVRERARANDMAWGSLLDDEKSGYRLLSHGGDGAVRSRGSSPKPRSW